MRTAELLRMRNEHRPVHVTHHGWATVIAANATAPRGHPARTAVIELPGPGPASARRHHVRPADITRAARDDELLPLQAG